MELASTGIPDLDLILGGGLPLGSLIFIAGGSGTGKTILAQQISFANATAERKALFYTLVSEPHSKLVRHLEQFEFFDPEALGERVDFIHLPAVLDKLDANATAIEQSAALTALVDEVVRASLEKERSVIVIDGIKALRDYARVDGFGFRGISYDLASKVAHSNAILIFVGEYTAEEVAYAPEFAVADGILYLADETFGRFDQRWLRLLKLRGADYLMGRHSFRIGKPGIEVFPRFESLAPSRESWTGERMPLGIEGIDEKIGGGLPRGSATLVAGPSGAGKSVLGLHFVADGIARGEHCLYLSFQQTDDQLIERGEIFGWPFKAAVESGLLRIRHLEPVEVSLDAVGAELRAAATGETRVKRVVVDSLAELEPAARGTARFPDYLTALTGLFASIGATTLLTSETTAFFGPAFELPHGLAFVADNVILLRYAEVDAEVRRVLAVIKMRDGDHAKDLLEVETTKHGMSVIGKFAGLTGVLGGNPTVTPPLAQSPAES
ncbi:MAG: circadian clock protein KaiC [Gaiellaceae bacterium]|jgi:circadian clock protein KaiC|nr:circadian clock protein KaiC [Gaiellaceae bacterium]